MRPGLDRIFHKPIIYLGCVRQYSKSNWKLYIENVRDSYHASLLHAFYSTFNVVRAGARRKGRRQRRCKPSRLSAEMSEIAAWARLCVQL
jgi:anthranilate 1,2-dioxygenase large subunit